MIVTYIMVGITNVTIEKFIEEENDDLQKYFIGVFSSNSITRYVNFFRLAKKRDGSYSFVILNMDRRNLHGTHWWSILTSYLSKQLFLFNSYRFAGLKAFIILDEVDY